MALERRINDLLEENNILRTYIAEIEMDREAWTEDSLRALNERLDRYILALRGVSPDKLAIERQRHLASQETVDELRLHINMLTDTVSRLKATKFENVTKSQLQKLLAVKDNSLHEENKVLKAQLRDALQTIAKFERERDGKLTAQTQKATEFSLPTILPSERKETMSILIPSLDLPGDMESFLGRAVSDSVRGSGSRDLTRDTHC